MKELVQANYYYPGQCWRVHLGEVIDGNTEKEAKEAASHKLELYGRAEGLIDVLNEIHNECFSAMEGAGLPEFDHYQRWAALAWKALNGE